MATIKSVLTFKNPDSLQVRRRSYRLISNQCVIACSRFRCNASTWVFSSGCFLKLHPVALLRVLPRSDGRVNWNENLWPLWQCRYRPVKMFMQRKLKPNTSCNLTASICAHLSEIIAREAKQQHSRKYFWKIRDTPKRSWLKMSLPRTRARLKGGYILQQYPRTATLAGSQENLDCTENYFCS